MEKLSERSKLNRALFWLILAAGLFARLWLFGSVPGDINQDEAFAGYEAYSLLRYGTDSAGYSFPVYLTAWGSGMNALETYLMIPFIALFGLETWVIRLPQLLTGAASLWVVYLTVRRLRDERCALWAMFLLAICPWHVLLSRWGLESNLAPGFLLFGLYFFLRGLEDSRFFPLSALMYGLSLYAYATIWPFVPLLLLLQLAYCARHGRLRGGGLHLALSALILALLALPLLLFLAVNFGLIDEIRLPFLSVPKLLYMRAGEISFKNIPANLKNLFKILFTQSDGLSWNCAGVFGLIYPLSLPFTLLGLVRCVRERISAGRERRFSMTALLLIQLLAGLLLGALISVNVNRVNIIFIPLVILTAVGVRRAGELAGKRLLPAAAAAYALFFICFELYYFTDYREAIQRDFSYGLEAAVDAVSERGGSVYLSADILYPDILFYSAQPTDEFLDTVEYVAYPAAFLRASSFGRWRFGVDAGAPDASADYILSPGTELGAFKRAGFTLGQYGNYTVALAP